MRIAKFLARAGIASRRMSEKIIMEGRVSVDNVIINSPALNVQKDSVVYVDNKPVEIVLETKLWMYYKPVGLITSFNDPQKRKTVFDELKGKLPHVISVGRLDINSEGLLLLTNNGDLARYFTLPKNNIKRVYNVRVFGPTKILDFDNKIFKIKNIIYGPVSIKKLSGESKNSWYQVILKEGKNREIRRIFEYLGYQVNRLIRVEFGDYKLKNLKPNEYREMDICESLLENIEIE